MIDKKELFEGTAAERARNKEFKVHQDLTAGNWIDDVVGSPPSWIVVSGTSILFFILAIILSLSWLIEYPETIRAKVNITSNKRPVILTARATGELFMPALLDGKEVRMGDTLGYIKDNVDFKTVIRLKQLLRDPLANLQLIRDLLPGNNLGNFQSELQDLILEAERLDQFVSLNTEEVTLQRMKSEKGYRTKIYENQLKQVRNELELLFVSKSAFKRDSLLYSDRVTARADYEKAQQAMLRAVSSYNSFSSELLNQESSLILLQKQIEETERILKSKRNERSYNMMSKVRFIEEEIEKWIYSRVLVSSLDGTVHLHKIWENDQHVSLGDELLYLIPAFQSVYGYAFIDQIGFGKVKEGSRVLIKLTNYPFQEFGILRGRVERISPVYTPNGYLVKVDLVDKLTTTYQKEIKFSQEMPGTCEIIVRDASLLSMFFYQFKYIFAER